METGNENNPFRCVHINMAMEQFNAPRTWFFRALQPRGLPWACVIGWYETAAGTGGVAGLMQTRDRAVSNESCRFYLKWMIWRCFSPLRHVFLVLRDWEDGLLWECQCELLKTLQLLERGRRRSPHDKSGAHCTVCQCKHRQHIAVGTEGSIFSWERQNATWAD